MSITLDMPFTSDKSIRSTNFFNNRLLSAEDLNREKDANRAEHKQIGRAVGDGIVNGLRVNVFATSPLTLTVTPGLAINRNGRALELTDPVQVVLAKPTSTNGNGAITVVDFEECEPPQHGVYILNQGVYLLTIKPSETGEGRAVVSGLSGASAGCNIKSRVAGVRFSLHALDELLNQELTDLQKALNEASSSTLTVERAKQNHKLRNRVAHRCFGTGDTRLASFSADPLGATATDYGLLARLRELSDTNVNKLTDCEAPLALLYWTTGGLQWIDMWSVRRRVTLADPEGFAWTLLAPRRTGETEAMLLQFQEQLENILNSGFPLAQIAAKDWFGYLPSVGVLPEATTTAAGLTPDLFLGPQMPKEIAILEGRALRALFAEAAHHEPIPTNPPEKLRLYHIWENMQGAAQSSSTRRALVFTSHTLPYRGSARFSFANWDANRFSASPL